MHVPELVRNESDFVVASDPYRWLWQVYTKESDHGGSECISSHSIR